MSERTPHVVKKPTGNPLVGFGRSCITEGCRHPREGHEFPDYTVHDDLYATAMVVEADGDRFALVSLDLCVLRTHPCCDVLDRIAAKTGVPANQIALHCTHTHASYSGNYADPKVLADLIAASITEATGRLSSAQVAHACRELGRGYNFNRRIHLSDDLGAHCVMFNDDCRTENGRVEAGRQLAKVVQGWEADWNELEMSRHENWADGPIDSFLHVISFRGGDGRSLGSIVRFAGHPVIVSRHWIGNQISRDAVGYVADLVAGETGAPCLYLTGPSGNQRLYCEEYTHTEAEKRGNRIGREAMKLFDGLDFSSFDRFGLAVDEPEFDVWPGFPKTHQEQHERLKQLEANVKAAVSQKKPPAEIKKLSEERTRMKYAGEMLDRCRLTPADAAAGNFRRPMLAFDLGAARLVTFPGETFMEIGRGVCEKTAEEVVTVQLVNGTCGYIPTAEEWPLGGYETIWCFTAPGTDRRMTEEAARLVEEARR